MKALHFATLAIVVPVAACVSGSLNVGSTASSCRATCDTPAGSVQRVTSREQAYGELAGRWLLCGGDGNLGPPSDAIGLEFGPATLGDSTCGAAGTSNCGGGNGYYLVQGPSGPLRGQGFAYQWTYDIAPGVSSGNGQDLGLFIHPAPNASWIASFSLYPCPKELELTPIMLATGPKLVWLDDGGAVAGDGGATNEGGGAGACAPAGTVEPVTSVVQAAADVAGRWRVCAGQINLQSFAPSDTAGVEFMQATPGGGACPDLGDAGPCSGADLYFLVEGDAGLARGAGNDYHDTYALESDPPLELVNADGGGWGTSIRYSPSPRELEISQLGYQGGATFISVP